MAACGSSRVAQDESRVIVADDSDAVREVLCALLAAHGHTVVGAAADGCEAVDLVDEKRPTVVVLDHRMPRMTGLEAAALLRRWHPELPVLIFSTSDEPSLRASAARLGVHGFYAKEDSRGLLDHLAALRTRVRRDAG
jgi:DNA-binding NarL/FixJ family response regulator